MEWTVQTHQGQMFVKCDEQIMVHDSIDQEQAPGSHIVTSAFEAQPNSLVTNMPQMSVPASRYLSSSILSNFAVMETTPRNAAITSFRTQLQSLPPAEYRLVHFFAELTPTSHKAIARQLNRKLGRLEAGSDGGKRSRGGSFSWLILTRGGFRPLWRCAGPVYGWGRCQSSLRSELTAIASLCLVLEMFCHYMHIEEIKCTIGICIDNQRTIQFIEDIRIGYDSRKYEANADILSILHACPMVVERLRPRHVKSHQDAKTKKQDLGNDARVNVLCDFLATRYLNQMREGPLAPQSTPLRPVSVPIVITVKGHTISNHYTRRLHEEIGDDRHQEYVRHKFNWDMQAHSSIDWQALEKFSKSVTLPDLSNASKLAHNWLPLGQRRQLLEEDDAAKLQASLCPCCLKEVETFEHLLRCPDPRRRKARYDALESLKYHLRQYPQGLLMASAIKQWTAANTTTIILPFRQPYQDKVDQAVAEQSHIGWTNFFRGYISSTWGAIGIYPIMMPPPISKANRLKRSHWKKARKSCLRSKLRQKAYRFNAIAISALQNYSLYLYKTRNDILHDGDEETEAIVNVRLNDEIRQLYRDKEDFSPDDKAYFRIPIERILRRPPRGRRRWLYLARLIASRATDRVTEGQQVMPSYFTTKHHTTSPKPTFEEPTVSPLPRYFHQTDISDFYDSPTLDTILEENPANSDSLYDCADEYDFDYDPYAI
jgi:hypothetical protein